MSIVHAVKNSVELV